MFSTFPSTCLSIVCLIHSSLALETKQLHFAVSFVGINVNVEHKNDEDFLLFYCLVLFLSTFFMISNIILSLPSPTYTRRFLLLYILLKLEWFFMLQQFDRFQSLIVYCEIIMQSGANKFSVDFSWGWISNSLTTRWDDEEGRKYSFPRWDLSTNNPQKRFAKWEWVYVSCNKKKSMLLETNHSHTKIKRKWSGIDEEEKKTHQTFPSIFHPLLGRILTKSLLYVLFETLSHHQTLFWLCCYLLPVKDL